MTRRKKERAGAAPALLKPPAADAGPGLPRPARRGVVWVAAAVLVVGVAGAGLWYALAPPVPEVSLGPDPDPELVKAVSEARGAVRRAPWSDQARGRLGMLLQANLADPEATATCFAQAEKLNPSDPRWPYLYAVAVKDKDPSLALELLRRSVELADRRGTPPDAPLLVLADLLREQGLLDEAGKAYHQLLRRQPSYHARAYLGLAYLALRRGQPEAALECVRRCSADPSTRLRAHRVAAEAHQRRGEPEAAAEAHRQADALPPDQGVPDPWADEVRALVVGQLRRQFMVEGLQAQGRLREAEEVQRQELRDRPHLRYLMSGEALLAAGRVAAAEADLREAVRLAPTSIEGHFSLGQALAAQKKYGAAAEAYRRVLELTPAHPGAYRELAHCALTRGEKAEAIRLLRQALQYGPNNAEIHRDLGEALATEGQNEEAAQHLARAIDLNPDDARARELLEAVRASQKPRR
jgi:tetratricopeptide (TPR) repeat protein